MVFIYFFAHSINNNEQTTHTTRVPYAPSLRLHIYKNNKKKKSDLLTPVPYNPRAPPNTRPPPERAHTQYNII